MAVLYDARGNEWLGNMDGITGQVLTDARTATATLGSLNAESVIDINGYSMVAFDVRTGSNATLTFVLEGTVDGTNYITLPFYDTANRGVSLVSKALAAATIGTIFWGRIAGMRRVRVRISAYTSGSVVVAMRAPQVDAPDSITPPFPATLWVTVTAAANTAATCTLPAAGAGLYHYITHIDMTRNATAALAGTATLIHTSTNLPGSPAWSVGNNMIAGGTQLDTWIDFSVPFKSSVANTNTTLVMAAGGLAVLNRINCAYYIGF